MTKKKECSIDKIESIRILDIQVHLLTEQRLHQYIHDTISKKHRALILNVNAHCYNLMHKNPWLQDFFNQSDITFCDGAGVALGAKILGQQVPKRITYADWMWSLSAFAEHQEITFFFIGAAPGIAEKAAQKLTNRFPNLKIKTHHGYFNKSMNSEDNQRIIQQINASKANILIVGFGMPLQEKWLQENWDHLEVNIALTGGAVFDYISGELKRGPRWMTDNNLEWLARLLIEPKRLWKRYIFGNAFFFYLILKERFRNGN
ncbi:MAG: glycosyltransferase [Candidatus Electrothrix sp. AR3]|nr:glycosyltransferase [Candidatus Electrothrix sp. AR3]